MKHKTIGYIVVGVGFSQRVACPMKLCSLRTGPKGGVLLFGAGVTLFTTRQQAQAAIRRTSQILTSSKLETQIHRVGVIVD